MNYRRADTRQKRLKFLRERDPSCIDIMDGIDFSF